MNKKMKLRQVQPSLSSTTECYMGGKLTEVVSVILSPSIFLRSTFITPKIGFSLSLLMRWGSFKYSSAKCVTTTWEWSFWIIWYVLWNLNFLKPVLGMWCHVVAWTLFIPWFSLSNHPEISSLLILSSINRPLQASEHIATTYAELRNASSNAKVGFFQ